jgi:GT2 family glycosyltransferase
VISVVIATCGSRDWRDLAMSRAYPSVAEAIEQVRGEVIVEHLDGKATIAQARNYGGWKAKNPWLVFLDADDELHPTYLPAMASAIGAMGNDGLSLFAPAVAYVTIEAHQVSWTDPKIPNTHMTMPPLNHCVIGTAVSRVVFQHVQGFREGYYPWEDYELWLRCISAGCTVRYVPSAIYTAHVREDSAHRSLAHKDAVRLAQRIHREHRARGRGSVT